ncbi:MAG: orotidine 5'-phosphate decarboxylase [Candidatus Brocadiae bacterium]|nr:orotidine 5'-phosphate decarboxylase [Candidatus Brocadiia bacterium]
MGPILQVALDFLNLAQALRVAREAMAGGADWLEAGTPLIKSEGLEAVRQLRAEFPQATLVADLKIMDAGRIEVEAAAKAGANVVAALGVASDSTLQECVKAAQNFGVRLAVDLIGCPDPVARARQAADWGADVVGLHTPIDEQMRGGDPFALVRRVAEAVDIPVAVAGGINSETVARAIQAGARIAIVGGAITKSADAKAATATIKQALTTGIPATSELYRRATDDTIRDILAKVSTPNISDGNHHHPGIVGLRPLRPGTHLVGTALTVRTAPGDWAKPVEAIDHAQPGDVIVVDAGGRPPACWGELATESCMQRGLAGIVVDGAVRDTGDIARIGLPCFSSHVASACGEPKGFGEIGATLRIEGVEINTGDWIVGDDDGLIVLPRRHAVEMANRAMDCLERENRVRSEIRSGATTLGQVVELLRWEKR